VGVCVGNIRVHGEKGAEAWGWEPVRLVASEGIEETEPAVIGWTAFGW
jgi:hypothetical protein